MMGAEHPSRAVMKYPGLLLLVPLLSIPLAGCSYTTYLSGADENGGTVNLVTEISKDSAIEKANEHCRQYNKVAHVIRTDQASSSLTFSCD
jgi:hypothetical protein